MLAVVSFLLGMLGALYKKQQSNYDAVVTLCLLCAG